MRTWKVLLSAIALVFAFVLAAPSASAEGVSKRAKTSSVLAAEPAANEPLDWIPSWNGLYVGVHGGAQSGISNLTLDHSSAGNLADINGLGFDRSLIGGVDLGASWRIKGTPFVLIAMASYEWGDTPFDVTIAGPGNVLHADVTPTLKAGGGLGWLLTNNAMLYTGYQYAQGKLSVSSPFFTTINRDLTGYNIPIGIEVPWTEMLKVGVQYDITRYDTEQLAKFGKTSLNSEIETQSVTLRLKLDLTKAFAK